MSSFLTHQPSIALSGFQPQTKEVTVDLQSQKLEQMKMDKIQQQKHRDHVISILSCTLEQLFGAHRNDILPEDIKQITMFHTECCPAISIHDYFTRLAKYCDISAEAMVLSLILLNRILHYRPNFQINSLNIHRLILTSMLCSAKFMDDHYFNNGYYARVGGVEVKELNCLEVELLAIINFDLYTTFETYSLFLDELSNIKLHSHCNCKLFNSNNNNNNNNTNNSNSNSSSNSSNNSNSNSNNTPNHCSSPIKMDIEGCISTPSTPEYKNNNNNNINSPLTPNSLVSPTSSVSSTSTYPSPSSQHSTPIKSSHPNDIISSLHSLQNRYRGSSHRFTSYASSSSNSSSSSVSTSSPSSVSTSSPSRVKTLVSSRSMSSVQAQSLPPLRSHTPPIASSRSRSHTPVASSRSRSNSLTRTATSSHLPLLS